MSKKSRFTGPFEKQHGKRAHTLLIPEGLKAAPLPYLLITVKAIDLEKVFNSDRQNLKTVC